MDGRSTLPLQQYYVIGRLQSVPNDGSCVNSTDPKIASNANPFLNCTLGDLPLNDPVVRIKNIAWLSNETIEVWWIFSEPVVVNSARWTFDVNHAADAVVVDKITVRQRSNSTVLGRSGQVASRVGQSDLTVTLDSNAVTATEYWIFEFSMSTRSESTKVALIHGHPNISKYYNDIHSMHAHGLRY